MSDASQMASRIQNSVAKVLENHNIAIATVKEFENMMDCKRKFNCLFLIG